MIKSIVFDLGNVLISFKPSEFLEIKNYSADIRKIILKDVFGSREWQLLDKGSLTVREAIDSISLKSSLRSDEIAQIFDLRKEIIYPLSKNIKLLPYLKKAGYKLFYLSNFPNDIFDEVKNENHFFKYFDGGIISADVKLIKPDIRIFKIFIEKMDTRPEECLYIDDIEENVTSAMAAGMRGFFTSGSLDISDTVYNILGISAE
jgi:putative hydrolase of the HAD superfamily